MQEIDNGAELVFYDFFTLYAGYKIRKNGEIKGYLTEQSANIILKNNEHKAHTFYHYITYEIIK